jgi:glycerophosphoryl diester phosphodiesterase
MGRGWWLVMVAVAATAAPAAQVPKKISVAHRGASAYAPEHTLAAYRLAVEQRADYVEQDLAVTKDGVLICLHDPTLERTTDVEQRFPDRATAITDEGKRRQVWLANDFTLAEIKTLDAGSWMAARFAGERVPTFDEAVALIRGRAGLYPELKTPEIYAGRDVDFVALVEAALDRHRLRGPAADPKTPVILQTFGESTARALVDRRIGVPVVLLFEERPDFDPRQAVEAWKGVVAGFGPDKAIVAAHPQLVGLAHAAGLTVTPYTFRSAATPGFATVDAEMAHYLYTLGVDALFTDNPDRFPRR